MAEQNTLQGPPKGLGTIEHHLAYLKLSFIAEQYAPLAKQAADKAWSHVDYLATLLEGEVAVRRDRATQSRIRLARFPVIKTLEQFRWDWPTRINRLQVQNHFRLGFIQDKANLIFLGGVGLGKTHLATALGYAACLQGYAVLFASAIDVINTLAAAKSAGRLKAELKKYTKPALLKPGQNILYTSAERIDCISPWNGLVADLGERCARVLTKYCVYASYVLITTSCRFLRLFRAPLA